MIDRARAALGRYLELGIDAVPEAEHTSVRVLNAFALVSYLLNVGYILVVLPLLPASWPVVAVQAAAIAGWVAITTLQVFGHTTAARGLSTWVATLHLMAVCWLVGDGATIWPFLAVTTLYPFLLYPRTQRARMVGAAQVPLVGVVVAAEWFGNSPPQIPLSPEEWRWLDRSVPLGLGLFPALLGVYHHLITSAAEEALVAEQARSERLLLNVLPALVADRLKSREAPIADRFDEVTVLFSDIVNFTRLSERTPPAELVALLDELFREFDAVVDRLGLEKIKTIGDAYMRLSTRDPSVTPDTQVARWSQRWSRGSYTPTC